MSNTEYFIKIKELLISRSWFIGVKNLNCSCNTYAKAHAIVENRNALREKQYSVL